MIHIVIPTCDQYSVVIPKTLTYFYRHWTLPHRITVLGVSRGTLKVPAGLGAHVFGIFLTIDKGWSANLLRYLAVMGDEPFLMFMDDHILFEVNNDLIQEAHEIIQRPDVGCVRLVPWPGPTLPFDVEGFGEIDRTLEYAISLQASFWKPQTLRDLLDLKWSPWQVELEGSKRAAMYDKRFVGCKTCAVNYKDYFCRGKPREGHAAWVDANL